MTKTISYEVETIISLIEDQLLIVDREITEGVIAGPMEDASLHRVTRSTILLKSLPEIVNDLLTDLNIK